MEDNQIIQLFFERDEEAIKETKIKYGAYCMSIARNILHNQEDCEECLNDTLFRAWKLIPPEKPRYFNLFLAKIIRNLAFDTYRKKHAEKRGFNEIPVVLDELAECISNHETSESIFHEKQVKELMNQFLRELPKKERNIFIRRYFFVESIPSIAERYCVSENTVYIILSRKRTELKEYLKKGGYFS